MTIWYVGPGGVGSDGNDGLSAATARASVGSLAIEAGDTVYFLAGTYRNASYGDGNIWKDSADTIVRLNNVHGAADAWITLKPAPGAEGQVKLQYDGNGAIVIRDSSFVRIEGLEIEGPNGSISLQDALDTQYLYRIPVGTDANGDTIYEEHYRDPLEVTDHKLSVDGAQKPLMFNASAISLPNGSHHVEFIGNNIHDTPAHAISAHGGNDYVTVSGNEISNATWYTSNGTHAVSFKALQSLDTNDAAKIFVTGNTFTDNYNLLVSWVTTKTAVERHIDEGKSIHIQNSLATPDPDQDRVWDHGEILIANNVVVRAGNAGITVNEARGVTIANNTIVDPGHINHFLSQASVAGSPFAGTFNVHVRDPGTGDYTTQQVEGFFNAQQLEEGWTLNGGALRLGGTQDTTIVNNLISISDPTYFAVDANADVSDADAGNIASHNLFVGGAGVRFRGEAEGTTETAAVDAGDLGPETASVALSIAAEGGCGCPVCCALGPDEQDAFANAGPGDLWIGFREIADAGFVDAAGGNYDLTALSPARNAGVDKVASVDIEALITTDIDGEVRTDGTLDVGAFEFEAPTTMATTTLNSDPRFGEQLQVDSITLPATAFTFEIDFALPADWQLRSEGVPLVQYGTGSHSSSGFAISTWSDNFDVYIAGRRFDTTIAVRDFIGTSHRLSITWDKATGTAKSYLDGVLVDTATVAQDRTISPNQPLTIGGGGGSEPNPILSLDDVRVFDHVRSASDIASFHDAALPGGQTGLAGYWQADGTGLPSAIGGAPLSLEQETITIADQGALTIGVPASGEIATAATHDWYTVTLEAGKTYTFAMVGTGAELLDDPYLELHSAGGTTRLARADDGAPGSNSWFTFSPETSGSYVLDAHAGVTDTGTYGISVAEGPSAVYDDAMGAGIIQGGSWSSERGAGATVTFGFQITDPGERQNFEPFNAVMQTATREILQLYADIANVTFVDANPDGLTDDAQMLFSAYDQGDGSGGHSHGAGNGDIHLNYGNRDEAPAGSYVWYTLLHEIGHSMGFSHPAGYGTVETAQFATDSAQYSVLSYHGAEDTGGNFGATGSPDTPMLLDILALHETYGANMTTRTGDTVYGFNATAGNRLYDFTQNTDPGLAIWDAGGTDTLDVSGYSQNQTITLVAGEFSNVGGLTNNVAIAYGATIENAVGGSGHDEVWGNAGANVLTGGLGADTLRGDDGDDRLIGDGIEVRAVGEIPLVQLNAEYVDQSGGDYNDHSLDQSAKFTMPATAVTVEMLIRLDANVGAYDTLFSYSLGGEWDSQQFTLQPNGSGSWALSVAGQTVSTGLGGDAFTSAEAFRLSITWDSATGAAALYRNGLELWHGTVAAGASLPANGNFWLFSGWDSTIFGAVGDIRVWDHVRSAEDLFDDSLIQYDDAASRQGLVANWQVSGSDTLADATGNPAVSPLVVQNVTENNPLVFETADFTRSYDDTLIGGAGNDSLDGGLGADTMEGGAGNDVYTVDSTSDVVREVLGEGLDTVNSSVSITLGVDVENLNLLTGAVAGAGNSLANHIVGNTVANALYGLDGNDVLYGGLDNDGLYGGNHDDSMFGEDGKDVLYGGTGNDRLDGGRHNDVLRAEAGNDVLTGGAGRDILYGGTGLDDFIYRSLADSGKTAATRDVIRDFSAHNSEDINLALIDANTRAKGNQRFKFIGTQSFDGDGAASAGELRYSHIGTTRLLVQGDVNGDGKADFSIEVDGLTSLQAADFIL